MSTNPHTIPVRAPWPRTRPSRTVHRLVAVAAGVVVSLVGWTNVHVVGGVDVLVGSGADARRVGVVDVVSAALVAGLAGWAALALVERVLGPGRRAVRVWVGISALVLALSLAGPLTADATTSTRWWLVALHTSVGVAIIAGMARDAAGGARRLRPDRPQVPRHDGPVPTRLRREVPR